MSKYYCNIYIDCFKENWENKPNTKNKAEQYQQQQQKQQQTLLACLLISSELELH